MDHDLRGRLGPGPGHGARERGARGARHPGLRLRRHRCAGDGGRRVRLGHGPHQRQGPGARAAGAQAVHRAHRVRARAAHEGRDRPLLPGRRGRRPGRLPVGGAAAQALAPRAGPGEGTGGAPAQLVAADAAAAGGPGRFHAHAARGGSARSGRLRSAPRAGTCAAARAPGTSSASPGARCARSAWPTRGRPPRGPVRSACSPAFAESSHTSPTPSDPVGNLLAPGLPRRQAWNSRRRPPRPATPR